MSMTTTATDLEELPRWKIDHIAQFLEYSLVYTRNNVVKKPGFPEPYINCGQRRFWRPQEVIAWAQRA